VNRFEALKNCGIKSDQYDLFFWVKNKFIEIFLMAMCVNDCLNIGIVDAIEEFIKIL
jgi:hypothetical protein